MLPTLDVRLLGDFRLTYGDEPVTSVDTARLQSLLAYLVLHRDAPQRRQHLAFRFWPDSTEKQARTNLRQLLHHLRHALPEADSFIEADTQTLQWHPDAPYTLDVAAFEQAVSRASEARGRDDAVAVRDALETAGHLYEGDLLPSCYDEWIEPERERLRQQYIAALDRLVRLLEEQRAYAAAIRYARRLLQKDPLREATYRSLMRLHALRSDRASALRAYHECATVLERELDVAPGQATRELYDRLLNLEASSSEQEPGGGLTDEVALVGRQQEWEQLRVAWRIATRGKAHLVLVEGEAGIGKTRLAEELLVWVGRKGLTTARTRCYAAEGRLAYAPVTDWLRTDTLQDALSEVDAVWRTEVARLVPELLTEHPDLAAPEPLTERWQRQRFFEALTRVILAGNQPLLLVIDDLQWCDQDTLEWLRYLLRFDPEAQLLVVGTLRIGETGTDHPLRILRRDLRRAGQLTEIMLRPLGEADTAALAEQVAESDLDEERADRLFRETEGNPLFVVECVRAGLVEISERSQDSRSSRSDPEPLPPKVHAVIKARLAQLSPEARALAGLAATVGRTFTFEVLAEAADRDEEHLAQTLDELWQRRIVREQGASSYDFSHDKLREGAYAEIRPARRRLLHRRVAEALETVPASDLEAVSGQIAAHFERAGRREKAITYYWQAGSVAQRVFANEEATSHFTSALKLLETLPESPQRDERELSLRAALGLSLIATQGWAAPDVGQVYTRARALCQQLEDTAQRFPVQWGLQNFHLVRAELTAARQLAEQFLHRAQGQEDPVLLVVAHVRMGISLFHLGELVPAREHLEQGIARYDPRQHRPQAFRFADPGVASRIYASHVLWHLGEPDQAIERSGEALDLADELAHPFSRAGALDYAAMLHQFRGESQAARQQAEAAVALCGKNGFPYYRAWGTIMQGWAQAEQGEPRKGIARMRRGLAALQDSGAALRRPYYLVLLAEACGQVGQAEEGLTLLVEALSVTCESKERWSEAELHRLRGELLLAQGADEQDVEACFQEALDVARRLGARSLELRAAVSLSHLWQRRGHREDAQRLLKTVYDEFTEGFDTPDLQEARMLLDDLS